MKNLPFKYLTLTCIIIVFSWSTYEFIFFRQTREIIHRNNSTTSAYIKQYWKQLPQKAEILSYWLQINHSISESERLFWTCRIATLLPDSETYCQAGELCMQNHLYPEALDYFKKAVSMVPERIKANYLLFKLYREYHQTDYALKIARKIVIQPVKVKNTFTLSVQGEMERFLQQFQTRIPE